MAKPPVLKAKEVAALLESWDSTRQGIAALTNSIAMLMADRQRFLFMPVEIFPPSF